MERLVSAGRSAKARWQSNRNECRTLLVRALVLSFVAILLTANSVYAYDESRYITVCKRAMDYLEKDFGALLTALAGMGAIVASALGGFKVAWSLLVVAIGTFILRNFIIGGDEVGFFPGKC